MKTISMRPLLAVLAAAALAVACDRNGDDTMGQKIDRAIDTTQQKLAAAGDRIAVETDRAVSALKQEKTEKVAQAGGNGTTATDASGDKPAGARSAEGRMSDTAITASIKTDYLKDPDLSVLKIDVDTRSGVVTLNGLAENEEARHRAERIASAVKGVKEVRNYLVIKRV
jgi:hyperosmotically inducible periplasmic protein